jgi:predicted Na+-dependent transporter
MILWIVTVLNVMVFTAMYTGHLKVAICLLSVSTVLTVITVIGWFLNNTILGYWIKKR